MEFYPPLPADLYFLFAFIFTCIGIFAFLWLIFFVETSRDLARKDRILGLTNRLLVSSFSLACAVLFWNLFGIF